MCGIRCTWPVQQHYPSPLFGAIIDRVDYWKSAKQLFWRILDMAQILYAVN